MAMRETGWQVALASIADVDVANAKIVSETFCVTLHLDRTRGRKNLNFYEPKLSSKAHSAEPR